MYQMKWNEPTQAVKKEKKGGSYIAKFIDVKITNFTHVFTAAYQNGRSHIPSEIIVSIVPEFHHRITPGPDKDTRRPSRKLPQPAESRVVHKKTLKKRAHWLRRWPCVKCCFTPHYHQIIVPARFRDENAKENVVRQRISRLFSLTKTNTEQ